MLKSVTHILMTCLLLISTTGLAVSKHYCGDDLVSVEFKAETEPCCNNDSCCHTETQFLQLDDDFLTAATTIKLQSLFSSDLIMTSSEVELPRPAAGFINSFNHIGPPPRCTQSRLALWQTYLL